MKSLDVSLVNTSLKSILTVIEVITAVITFMELDEENKIDR